MKNKNKNFQESLETDEIKWSEFVKNIEKSQQQQNVTKKKTKIKSAVFFKKRRTRRLKNSNLERNFICGCGKSYLSNAALYTHTKTKHSGKYPLGTKIFNKTVHHSKQFKFFNDVERKFIIFNKEYEKFSKLSRSWKVKTNSSLIHFLPINRLNQYQEYVFELFVELLVTLEKIRKELFL